MKCGPSLEPDALIRLLDMLNPERKEGRITLITRYGHDKIEAGLPKLVRAVMKASKGCGLPSGCFSRSGAVWEVAM
ncbi:MAG: Phospho-2-dehydro-3-deoxyheptonate aldolase [Betaproteobacteria bacterium ADurb.Bin341]|nr:MAG: Phospho-2-dehydro-3-deoxyheptonate aldolase [Betaproteobacteria bacterium ADurb.Bin341]